MRVYAKASPDAALEVLSQTVAAINKDSKEHITKCRTTASNPEVLSTRGLLNHYQLLATLHETDEAGVLNAISQFSMRIFVLLCDFNC